jgi:hypothetical protein
MGDTLPMSNTKTNLKGSKCYGEFHTSDRKPGLFLYRLADKSFAVVEKAEFSGRIVSVEPIEGRTVERYDSLNLGYAVVSMYRVKQTAPAPQIER